MQIAHFHIKLCTPNGLVLAGSSTYVFNYFKMFAHDVKLKWCAICQNNQNSRTTRMFSHLLHYIERKYIASIIYYYIIKNIKAVHEISGF